MSELPLRGGCLCGAVRFEIAEPFVSAGWCHCGRCQRRTGGPASVSARVAPGSFTIVEGEGLVASYRPSEGFAKEFCSRCGSQLWSRDPEDPDVRSVRLGVLDGDPGLRPSYHQFVAYAAVWQPLPEDGLPRYPERRPA
jgi:hypothetical protein